MKRRMLCGHLDAINIRKKEIDYIYRTPFTEQKETFVSVQSIVPDTLNYKIGEGNLNVISMKEFLALCNQLNWKVELLEKKETTQLILRD